VTRRNPLLTCGFTANPSKCRPILVRSASPRRTAVAIREMRTSVLSPGLCLLLIALLLQPIRVEAATAQQTKELFKIYAHTKLMNNKQYYCIEKLWTAESRWDPTARNKKSSAYGIPQLLHLKETNPYKQIDKGIEYITHRYNTPCQAYLHHKKVGHY
jgi:hypothetical protein